MSMNLKENQLLAISMVANGMTGKAIAEELNVTEETVSRWKQLPEFQAAVNSILKDVMNTARERVRCLMGKALNTLENAIESDGLALKIKVNMAFKILELCDMKSILSEEIGPDDPERVTKKQKHEDFMDSLDITF